MKKRIVYTLVLSVLAGVISAPNSLAANLITTTAVDEITVTSGTAAVSVGTQASTAFTVSFGDAGNGTLFGGAKITLVKPARSQLSLSDSDGSGAGTTYIVVNTGATGVTTLNDATTKDSANGDQVKFTPANAVAASANSTAGNIELTPDVVGTYTVTITGLLKNVAGAPSVASAVAAASKTFTVTATAVERVASDTSSITLANVNTATEVDALARVNFMANMTDISNLSTDRTVTFQSSLISYPAGGFVQVTANSDATGLDGATLTDTPIYTATGGGTPLLAVTSTTGST